MGISTVLQVMLHTPALRSLYSTQNVCTVHTVYTVLCSVNMYSCTVDSIQYTVK